jgi:hypothetical protein
MTLKKKNEYLPSSTTFIIANTYTYKDFLNKESVYYILSSRGVKYILGEDTLNSLQKPIYKNAKVPMKTLDELYKRKLYGMIYIVKAIQLNMK